MISHTGQYCIRALVYLAKVGTEANVTSADVAAATGLPKNYLTKVLNALVQTGILESTRGPRGGFRLSVPPGDLCLSEALAPFEVPDPGQCLLGPDCCRREEDCPCRTQCRRVASSVHRFLDTTSIADLAGDGDDRGSTTVGEQGNSRPPKTHLPGRQS